MMDREERDIQIIRMRLVDLIKSFYMGEPDAEKISRWRGIFSVLTKERVNAQFDTGAGDILQYLENNTLEELQNEYYKLFTDPFTDLGLSTSASQFFDGRSQGKTLVDLRSLLIEVGIEKNEDVKETEDSLVVMLDIYRALIEGETDAADDRREGIQEELLVNYLIPFSQKFLQESGDNKFATFYQASANFLCGYLEMEKGLIGSVMHSS